MFVSCFPGGDAGRRGKGAWGCGGTAVGGNYTAGMCNLTNSITYGSELSLYSSLLAGGVFLLLLLLLWFKIHH